MNAMQVQVLSTRETIFNKGKGDEQKMYQIYAADDTGALTAPIVDINIAPF